MLPLKGPYKTSQGKFVNEVVQWRDLLGKLPIWGKPCCIRFSWVLNNKEILHKKWLPNLQEGPWHSVTSDVHRVWVVDMFEYACNSHTLLLSKELTWVGRQLDIKMWSLGWNILQKLWLWTRIEHLSTTNLLGSSIKLQWILEESVTNMTWTCLHSTLESGVFYSYRPL